MKLHLVLTHALNDLIRFTSLLKVIVCSQKSQIPNFKWIYPHPILQFPVILDSLFIVLPKESDGNVKSCFVRGFLQPADIYIYIRHTHLAFNVSSAVKILITGPLMHWLTDPISVLCRICLKAPRSAYMHVHTNRFFFLTFKSITRFCFCMQIYYCRRHI